MPVTFHPSSKPLEAVDERPSSFSRDPLDLLNDSTRNEALSKRVGEIFQSSFTRSSPSSNSSGRFAATDLTQTLIKPAKNGNGFISAALKCFNHHHHLVIRPDDVWMTILTQFNLYVNANAEALRHLFVSHPGQKELEVDACGTRYTVDFGGMADQMGAQIQKNVLDPDLREWIIPHFSTTTFNDRIVSAVIMMATLSKYFSYKFSLQCGLPAVTLLGERSDWQLLLTKIDKLPTYGAETAQWATLLRPVLKAFVRAFDDPDSRANKDFWQRIAHYRHEGSGTTYLSGWITAFCFFDDKGKALYPATLAEARGQRSRQSNTRQNHLSRSLRFATTFGLQPRAEQPASRGVFELEGVKFHRLDTDDIPPGYAHVKVKLDDNGQLFDTLMVAGLVGTRVESGESGRRDRVSAEAGWWLFEDKGVEEEDRNDGM